MGNLCPPALFLFEVLKMGKLTRGPLVLYHRPKYWSRKPVIKNDFRILQTILKASVKFQKDRLKTVVGVTGTRYLLPSRPRWLSWMRRLTGDQEVAGSTPAEVGDILSWRLIVKYFLRSFSPFRWFKKGSCQFLAKECAQYLLTA